MRRWWVVIRATVLEMSSEPLALLLTFCAAFTVAITSLLHFHQFGESTRMARDAGLSALLVFGILQAIFCTIKAVRREIESGTAQMALAHSLSRPAFLLSKMIGASISSMMFTVTVSCVVADIVIGAAVGGFVTTATGDCVAILWPTSLKIVAGVILLPLVLATLLDWLGRFRFTKTATILTLVCAVLSLPLSLLLADGVCAEMFPEMMPVLHEMVWKLLPALVVTYFPLPLFAAVAAAFAVRFKDNTASSISVGLFFLMIPFLSNYYLSDALASGGSLSWSWVGIVALATLPLIAAFAWLGVVLFADRDVG